MEEKKKVRTTSIEEPTKYKLNVYSTNGTLRSAISAGIYQDMAIRFGDIMRSISSTRWMTMNEICDAVWQIEKKMKHPSNRTRRAIEDAVGELIERTMVITR